MLKQGRGSGLLPTVTAFAGDDGTKQRLVGRYEAEEVMFVMILGGWRMGAESNGGVVDDAQRYRRGPEL